MRLGEILVKHGLISESQLYSALARREADGKRIGSYLVEKGILSTNQVALALAEQVGVPPALERGFRAIRTVGAASPWRATGS